MKLSKIIRLIAIALVCIAIFIIANNTKVETSKAIFDKYNVVLISLDTLSAQHLPCYGYKRNTAPNLCKFADENILFLNSYSQSPTTLNSHFSIFTSLYPHTSNMTNIAGESLNKNYLTLAQLYKMNGYKTFYYGPLYNLNMPLNRGIERGFDVIWKYNSKYNEENWDSVYKILIENTESNQPSFFFLHTFAVHDPYLTGHKAKHLFTDLPEYTNIALDKERYGTFSQEFLSYCARYGNDYVNNYFKTLVNITRETSIIKRLKQTTNFQERISIFNSLNSQVKNLCIYTWNQSKINKNDEKQIEYFKALYDEQIHALDENLGEFLKLMTNPKIANNTIIIITSDHGEEFMEHGNLFHSNNIYRTSTQVPLVMRIPGVSPKKITELVQGIDIYPTIISLTNIAPISPLEGINLSGLIKGKKNAKTNSYIRSEWKDTVAIQNYNLRYYFNSKNDSPIGLYDLTNDPQEQINLKNKYPNTINQFKKLIK